MLLGQVRAEGLDPSRTKGQDLWSLGLPSRKGAKSQTLGVSWSLLVTSLPEPAVSWEDQHREVAVPRVSGQLRHRPTRTKS
jgi:hypothetical protein